MQRFFPHSIGPQLQYSINREHQVTSYQAHLEPNLGYPVLHRWWDIGQKIDAMAFWANFSRNKMPTGNGLWCSYPWMPHEFGADIIAKVRENRSSVIRPAHFVTDSIIPGPWQYRYLNFMRMLTVGNFFAARSNPTQPSDNPIHCQSFISDSRSILTEFCLKSWKDNIKEHQSMSSWLRVAEDRRRWEAITA